MSYSDIIAYKFRPSLSGATLGGSRTEVDHTASIFRDQALYFNSISSFNDPFEPDFICPEKPKNDANAFQALLSKLIGGVGGSAADVNLFLGNPLARWFMFEIASNEHEHASIINELEHQYRNYMFRIGVFCLNQGYDDILSWSHYADNHKGIAIGFDVEELYQSTDIYFPEIVVTRSPIPITYVSAQEMIDIMAFTPKDFVRSSLSTKSVHWSYEREVRYLAFPKKRSISYSDIVHLIRKPILEKIGSFGSLRTNWSTSWGIKNGRTVNFMDEQDQYLADYVKVSFTPPDSYPIRKVYGQITELMIPEETVARNSIPFNEPGALKEVIFGSQMTTENVKRNIRWINDLGIYKNLSFYQMAARGTRFELERTRVSV